MDVVDGFSIRNALKTVLEISKSRFCYTGGWVPIPTTEFRALIRVQIETKKSVQSATILRSKHYPHSTIGARDSPRNPDGGPGWSTKNQSVFDSRFRFRWTDSPQSPCWSDQLINSNEKIYWSIAVRLTALNPSKEVWLLPRILAVRESSIPRLRFGSPTGKLKSTKPS